MMRVWPVRLSPRAAEAEPAEGELTRRARRGDAEAFAALVHLHQHAIYRLALRMVGPDAAEDVAQQAFLKAWQGLARFAGGSTFGTWLHRIAVNQCLDHLRRAARFRPLPLDEAHDVEATADDPADAIASALADEARRRALAWALERAPSEDRLLLHLRVAEERSYDDIAMLLKLNPRTVGTRLYRARARLHRLIGERLQEDGYGLC